LGVKEETMGMFDYMRCQYPLPVEGAQELEYQTKDTPAQWLDQYEIRVDGTLWHEDYDIEDRSDQTADELHRILGMMTRVNERWEPEPMTGEIVFYANGFAFSAYFVDGMLKHLEILKAPNAEVTGGPLAKRPVD